MTNLLEQLSIDANEVRNCPDCGAHAVHVSLRRRSFMYGSEKLVKLIASYPIWTCEQCGFSYKDGRGEDIEHVAICRYLNLLTPQEIRELRERHGLSRKELAKLTQFGEASIKRWETGSLIQNHSADRFLRLIDDDPSIIEKLREIAKRLAKE